MKNFHKLFFITVFLINFLPIKPIGAGVIFYRYTKQDELLFLMALDPHQSAAFRKGFEFPAGSICDHAVDGCDVANLDPNLQPKDFLKGAIREALEELVFAPVVHSTLNLPGQPYDFKIKNINQDYEKKVIDVLHAEIIKQGMIYLFKQRVNGKVSVTPSNQFALFFCDITSFYKQGLLEAIQAQRKILHTHGFRFFHIGAEPNQFAWVKGSVLENAIKNSLRPVEVIAEKVVNEANVLLNQKIIISDSCFGMMRDRSQDQQNPQPNEYHAGDEKSSSMSSVLKVLLNPLQKKSLPVAAPFNNPFASAPNKPFFPMFHKPFVPTLDDFENKLQIFEKDIVQFFENQGFELRNLVRRLNIEQEYKDLIFSDVRYWNMFKFKTDKIFHEIKDKKQAAAPKAQIVVSQKKIENIANLIDVLKAFKK